MKCVPILFIVFVVLINVQIDCNIVGRRLAKVSKLQPRYHHHEHAMSSEVKNHGHHHPSFRTVVHGKIHSVSALTDTHGPVRHAARESYHKGLVDGALRARGHIKGQIVPPKVRMSSTLAHHSRPHQHMHVHHVHTHGSTRL